MNIKGQSNCNYLSLWGDSYFSNDFSFFEGKREDY